MSKSIFLFSPLLVGEGPGVRSKMARTFFSQKSSDFSPHPGPSPARLIITHIFLFVPTGLSLKPFLQPLDE
jgi:hypothetical protein